MVVIAYTNTPGFHREDVRLDGLKVISTYCHMDLGTLEIDLSSKASGIRLCGTTFKAPGLPNPSELIVGPDVKKPHIDSYRTPQKAFLVLLLRAFGSNWRKTTLNSEEETELTRSLVGVILKQEAGKSFQWLYYVTATPFERNLRHWFIPHGNTNHNRQCSVSLGPKWQTTKLIVRIGDNEVPHEDFENLAQAIVKGEAFDEASKEVKIDSFRLGVWSKALNRFSEEWHVIKRGDLLQIQIGTNRRCYLYVIWLDQTGKSATLYPWAGTEWNSPTSEVPVSSLTIPSPACGNRDDSLRVDGPAGTEHVIVLAGVEPLSPNQRKLLRVIVEGLRPILKCPPPQTPIIARFGPTQRDPNRHRIVHRVQLPESIKHCQQELARRFTNEFAGVLVCTIKNEG